MSRLRILADDLTGAVDSAARFVATEGVIQTFWAPVAHLPFPAAIDAGTRLAAVADAFALIERLAPLLEEAEPAFKKFDSLLRGHAAAEIAACARGFDHCVIAPAFPEQNRRTRGGRQYVQDGTEWRVTGPDLAAELAGRGLTVRLCRPGDTAPEGISLWDASSNAEMAQLVAECRCLAGRVLWCGTAGLAGALAGETPVPRRYLPGPTLALVGSDHPVSVAQLSAAWARVRRIDRGDAEEAARMVRLLHRDGALAVAAVVPPHLTRAEAASHIARCFDGLLGRMEPPGTLLICGGETLRAVCTALGGERLDVDGEVMAGIPTSILRGGVWNGVRIVSKAGAFGDPGMLGRLLDLGVDHG